MIDEKKIRQIARKYDCQVELYKEHDVQRVFSAERAQIHGKDSVTSQGFAVRTIKGRKIGFYPFEKKEEFSNAVVKSLKLARMQEAAGYFFPSNRGLGKGDFDSRADSFEKWGISKLEGMMRVQAKKKVKPVQNLIGAFISQDFVINSEGGNIHQKTSSFFASSQCGYKETEGDDSFTMAKYVFSPLEVAKNAADFAIASANAKPIASGKYEIVFDIRALYQMLQLFLPFNFSGESLRKKLTKLEKGAKFAQENISITDDPFIEEGLHTKEFDDEGFILKELPIVKNGLVNEFIFDMHTAAKMKGALPGRGFRSNFNGAPSSTFTNIHVEGGDLSNVEKECDKGIYINSFLTSGANPVTGDFSFPLMIAFNIGRGEMLGAIKGAMMKGNFFEMMKTAEFEKKTEIYNGLKSGKMKTELEIVA